MVSVDDTRLNELAAEPPERLWPVLDRAVAMAPLVVLMAVLPGLTALVLVPPERPAVGVASTRIESVVPEIASPWGRWLAEQPWRGWLALDKLAATWLPVVPAFFSSVILVWMVWHAARGLFGPRTGLLAVLAVCCHTPVLMLGRVSEPLALSAVVATVSVTGFVTHLQCGHRSVSLSALVSMLGLATTFLLAAPLACPVLILLAVAVACHPVGELGVWGHGSTVTRTRIAGRWHGPVSGLVVIGGALLLVSAWSLRFGAHLPGSELLPSVGRAISGWPGALERIEWPLWLGWLSGLVLLGTVDVVRGVFGADRGTRPVAVLAMAWAILVPLTIGLAESGYPVRLAEAFVVIPLAILAARGIESVCDRRVGVGPVVAATCLSGCLGTERLLDEMLEGSLVDPWLRTGLLVVAAVVVGAGVALSCRNVELYRRRVLLGCLALVLAAQVITGWLNVAVAALESMV